MILIKSDSEIELMYESGQITGGALALAEESIRPGMTTGELDALIEKYIRSHGARPSFKNYNGFPASACISVNEVIVHGIPGKRVLEEGDIVSVDVGSYYKGYHSDAARTFPVGKVSEEAKKLIEVTQQSFFEGMKAAYPGKRIGDIGSLIQSYAESFGYGVVRDMVGHGIGTQLHEDPQIPNFAQKRRGMKLRAGMTLAIEPMINIGRPDVAWLDDDWTVVSADGSLSAHYENTILITDGEPEILTLY